MKRQSAAPRRLQPKEPVVDKVLLYISLFFLVGMIVGVVCSKSVSVQTGQELSHYLEDYISLAQDTQAQVLWVLVGLYMRYVVLAFFLGFVSIGVLLLPVLSAIYGGMLSFSVCTLVATFGDEGIYVALALFGLRTLLGIPCYLWVAGQAHRVSYGLAQLCCGVKKGERAVYSGSFYMGFGLCLAILLLGVCIEYHFAVQGLAWAVSQV